MTEKYELSRRKALAALGTIGAAGAGVGVGTSAFFSDQETFTNNQLVAGELDLKVAVAQHYVDWLPDTDTENGNVSPDAPQETDDASMANGDPDLRLGPGSSGGGSGDTKARAIELDIDSVSGLATGSLVNEVNGGVPLDRRDTLCNDDDAVGGDDDDAEREIVQLRDVKPGDFGIIRFEVSSCDNPAFLWAQGRLESADENGLTEPERNDPDEDGDPGSTDPADVELLDEVKLALVGGDVASALSGGVDLSPQRTLRELDGGLRMELEGDIDPEDGGGAEDARNCFEGEDAYRAFLVWWVPIDHGNEIQSDSATFSLGLYAEQCRHNDGSGQFGNNGDDTDTT